jgi:thioredoxin 1
MEGSKMLRMTSWWAAMVVLALGVAVLAAEAPTGTTPAAKAIVPATVEEAYPGLASSVLKYARIAELPDGILLDAPGVTISEKELAAEAAKAPENLRDQLDKSAFFLLESIATPKLLLAAAKQEAARQGKSLEGKEDAEIIKAHLSSVIADVGVTDDEISAFYAANKDMCGGASLTQAKTSLKQYLIEQKQQDRIRSYVGTLGQSVPIKVSAPWALAKSVLAKDNVVDKLRASGKPSLVDFGSKGCVPCDMLAPILETLRTKYSGKANVQFVSVQTEQILASRYGIEAIPVQVFFDKNGAEVFRHMGFWPQDELEKKLAEMGVK